MTINIVTLGCSKNSVDSEVLASRFRDLGYEVVFESDKEADTVLINTCSFIQDAKEESIDEIFLQVERKKRGEVRRVFVMGCLAQRYRDELAGSIPEVDGFYTFAELPKLLETPSFDLLKSPGRLLSTPPHYAYMKISEGCDRHCAFCAIPLIRGPQVSKPADLLEKEAGMLAEKGIKELILIAQDLTSYGTDLNGRRELESLLVRLAGVPGLEWIRLHYAFPNHFPYEILDVMREYSHFCRYLDIPLQHVSENVLRSMNRPSSPEKMYKLVETIREKVPGIAIRTTLLSGFPTETETDHKQLMEFVRNMRFERLGVFSYSMEEETPAYSLGDPVSEKIKERRLRELMELQESISMEINEDKIGEEMKVMVDEEEEEFYVGRTEFDSPEVDNSVLISKKVLLTPGRFSRVKITGAQPYDLFGDAVVGI